MLRAVAVDFDDALRDQAFAYLERIGASSGGIVRRAELEAFTFEGRRIPLISRQQGIWKPAVVDSALSILTAYVAPNEIPPLLRPRRTGGLSTVQVARHRSSPGTT